MGGKKKKKSLEREQRRQELAQEIAQAVEKRKAWYEGLGTYTALILLFSFVVLALVIRVRMLDIPLERDEGEYAYGGQLLLQGLLPYEHLYNMKLPGIYAAYAFVLGIFGHTDSGIHLGLLFMNLLTTGCVFLLGRKLMDVKTGLFAAAIFAVWSLDKSVTGVYANAEQFVILPAMAGLVCLLHGMEKKRPWWLLGSGILLGIGFMMKQHGIMFAMAGGLFLFIKSLPAQERSWMQRIVRLAACAGGMALPYLLTVVIYWMNGALDRLIFWTIKYASAYTSLVTKERAIANFKYGTGKFVDHAGLMLILTVIGLTALFWHKPNRRNLLFMLLFGIFSCLAIVPGFFFRTHYFIFLIPAFSVFGGMALGTLSQVLSGRGPLVVQPIVPGIVLCICLIASVYPQRDFFFHMTPIQASRSVFGHNPFPEAKEIARVIKEQTTKDDKLAVIGSEPQIYFYARRRAATGYVYTYALMEEHDYALEMQNEMIREVEEAKPAFIFYVNAKTSWLTKMKSHRKIFNWWDRYKRTHYEKFGVTEVFSDVTRYHWAPNPLPNTKTKLFLEIWKRKS